MKNVIIRRILTLDGKNAAVMVFYDDGNGRQGKYSTSPELYGITKFSGWDNLNIPAECTETGSAAAFKLDFSQDFPGKFEYIVSRVMEE